MRGLKFKLNTKFFSQNAQYKRDIKEYREKKAVKDAEKAEKDAKKETKKAEKEAKKAKRFAENNETNNEVLVAETPEREINNGTEE